MQDLATGPGQGGAAFHMKELAVAPHLPHQPFRPGAVTDGLEENLLHLAKIRRPHPRVDDQAHTRPSVWLLFFNDLIVRGSASEASGEHLLQNTDHVRIQKRHPPHGDLLETAD